MSGDHGAAADAADQVYEAYMGRWSRRVAGQFLQWLDLPCGLRWLDVGCGTGVLNQSVRERCAPSGVIGIDPSADYIAHARAATAGDALSFQVGDAQALPFADNGFDVVVSGLVINFVPDKARAASEMVRVTRPGGTVALYVWDLAGAKSMMRHFWEVAATVDPAAAQQEGARGSAVTRPEVLMQLFRDAGLHEMATHPIDITARYRDMDDYWLPMINNAQAVGRYCRSLPSARLAEIRHRLSQVLPVDGDGAIAFEGRAWALRGLVRPS